MPDPDDERINGLLPPEAVVTLGEYRRLADRHAECLQAVRDAQVESEAWRQARLADMASANEAVGAGRPARIPEHAAALRAAGEAAALEIPPLAAHGNAALDRLDAVLAEHQPEMVAQAYVRMNRVLGDRRSTWRQRLAAIALVEWVANVRRTLTVPDVNSDEYERAEQLLAHGPAERARRVVEQMDPELRAHLRGDKVNT